jgi:hypothetical protein
MSANTDDILKMLKDIESTFSYSVYIPSLKKEVNFKQLTTEQLKTLYKTTINRAILNLEFNTNFNNIIKENCLDVEVDINKLTIYDKIFIFVKTRIECLSPDIKFYLNEDEKDELNTTDNTVVISILEHYNKFVDKKICFEKQTYNANQCSIRSSLQARAVFATTGRLMRPLQDLRMARLFPTCPSWQWPTQLCLVLPVQQWLQQSSGPDAHGRRTARLPGHVVTAGDQDISKEVPS